MIAVESKVPTLRFPEFVKEWEEKKLGDTAEIITGSTPDTSNKTYYGGSKLFVSPGDMNNGRYISSTNTKLTETGFFKGRKVKSGSILVVCIGSTIGKVAQAKYDCITNQQINAVCAKVGFDNNFLFSQLERKAIKIRSLAGEQAVPIINKSTFSKVKISSPSLPEQQKIAAFLTAVDAKIELLTKKKTLLEQYKKGVMQQLFSQQIRFKDDKGEDFPNWEEKRLGEITYKVDKKNKNKELLPIYSISNINGFIPQGEQFDGMDSNERGYDISLYKIVEKQTFAYNPARINVGSIGYSGDLGRVIVSSLYVCFKTSDIVNDQFFNYFLQTEHFKTSVLRNGEGGVRIYLFYENFSQITIMLPSIKEQIFISNFIYTFDTKIGLVSNQLEYTKTFKKSLLQQMFV